MGTGTTAEHSLLSTTLITLGHCTVQLSLSTQSGAAVKGRLWDGPGQRTGAGPCCTGPGPLEVRRSELFVHVAGVVHQLAACEELAVLEDLLGLQVMVLILVSNGDHLLGFIEGIVLVHGVHVVL